MADTDGNKVVKLFIDSDVGIDDALAIIWLAHQKNIEILGITTVCGNNTMNDATHNVLTLFDVIQRNDIPVTMGADRPLLVSPIRFGRYCSKTGKYKKNGFGVCKDRVK